MKPTFWQIEGTSPTNVPVD